ncbi:hypothetical protein [Cysteiniphilum marinum]|uniref:hypothetical protein n=1 Tax=Cysteiniphilum marinum TaxID=2774191 RepID=UPI001939F2EB|nr:hypothetical protein [Cysteiniphilum marinum]
MQAYETAQKYQLGEHLYTQAMVSSSSGPHESADQLLKEKLLPSDKNEINLAYAINYLEKSKLSLYRLSDTSQEAILQVCDRPNLADFIALIAKDNLNISKDDLQQIFNMQQNKQEKFLTCFQELYNKQAFNNNAEKEAFIKDALRHPDNILHASDPIFFPGEKTGGLFFTKTIIDTCANKYKRIFDVYLAEKPGQGYYESARDLSNVELNIDYIQSLKDKQQKAKWDTRNGALTHEEYQALSGQDKLALERLHAINHNIRGLMNFEAIALKTLSTAIETKQIDADQKYLIGITGGRNDWHYDNRGQCSPDLEAQEATALMNAMIEYYNETFPEEPLSDAVKNAYKKELRLDEQSLQARKTRVTQKIAIQEFFTTAYNDLYPESDGSTQKNKFYNDTLERIQSLDDPEHIGHLEEITTAVKLENRDAKAIGVEAFQLAAKKTDVAQSMADLIRNQTDNSLKLACLNTVTVLFNSGIKSKDLLKQLNDQASSTNDPQSTIVQLNLVASIVQSEHLMNENKQTQIKNILDFNQARTQITCQYHELASNQKSHFEFENLWTLHQANQTIESLIKNKQLNQLISDKKEREELLKQYKLTKKVADGLLHKLEMVSRKEMQKAYQQIKNNLGNNGGNGSNLPKNFEDLTQDQIEELKTNTSAQNFLTAYECFQPYYKKHYQDHLSTSKAAKYGVIAGTSALVVGGTVAGVAMGVLSAGIVPAITLTLLGFSLATLGGFTVGGIRGWCLKYLDKKLADDSLIDSSSSYYKLATGCEGVGINPSSNKDNKAIYQNAVNIKTQAAGRTEEDLLQYDNRSVFKCLKDRIRKYKVDRVCSDDLGLVSHHGKSKLNTPQSHLKKSDDNSQYEELREGCVHGGDRGGPVYCGL